MPPGSRSARKPCWKRPKGHLPWLAAVVESSTRALAARGPPSQCQVRRPVDQQRHYNQIAQQIHPSRYHLLLARKRPPCPVDIEFRPPEMINGHHHPSGENLTFPSTPVVTQPPDSPQQKRWRDQ